MTLGGAEQTVVADFDEAWGEDVLQEAADELDGGDGAVLKLVSGGLFVRESDSALFQFTQAVVTEGDAKDVRSQILKSQGATAHRLRVEHPVFAPNSRGQQGKQFCLFQCVTKLGAEDHGQGFDGDKEVFA